jgi:hypothetical protein
MRISFRDGDGVDRCDKELSKRDANLRGGDVAPISLSNRPAERLVRRDPG